MNNIKGVKTQINNVVKNVLSFARKMEVERDALSFLV